MIRTLVVAYSGFVLIWICVFMIWPDSWWPFIVLNKLACFFLIAAWPMLLAAIITKRIRTIGIALAPVCVFIYFYWPFFMSHPKPDTHGNDLRVMSYNLWNQNKDVGSIVKAISVASPDILAVQELMSDVQDEFIDALRADFPYYHVSEMVYGGTTALFSRHELMNVTEIDFNIDRPAIAADISFDGQLIRVIGAHLNPSYYAYHDRPALEIPAALEQYIDDQRSQVLRLLKLIRHSPDVPVILACDCNIQRTASNRILLESELDDSAATLGWQSGDLPRGAKFERDINPIDYIWHTSELVPTGLYRSRTSGGSDHAPVFADFAITKQPVCPRSTEPRYQRPCLAV